MGWIKKNLFWVVGGLVALGLLGGASFYLYTSTQKEKQLDDEIAAKLAKRNELDQAGVPPKEAIEAIKQDQKRVEKLVNETREFFKPVGKELPKSGSEFQRQLDDGLDLLEKSAEISAVALPPKPYYFTFKPQKEAVQIKLQDLKPLSLQLAELSAICQIIFKAKVNAIDNIRRMPVAKDDVGPNEYLDKRAVTNALTIHVPYEVTFRGLSSELAEVLDGLAKSTNCFLIKALNIETSNGTAAPSADQSAPGMQPGLPGHNPMQSRYGAMMRSPGAAAGGEGGDAASAAAARYRMMQRYGPMMQQPPPETPAPVASGPKGPAILLDEKQLRITMTIEAVRLKDASEAAQPAAKPPKAAVNPAAAGAVAVDPAAPAAPEGGN